MRGLILAFVLLMSGCGYVPSSHLAKEVVGESIYTKVIISLSDPQNTVIIKDAVDAAVLTRFRASLADEQVAKTKLIFNINSISYNPMRYDNNGYVITYRTVVNLGVNRASGDDAKSYSSVGYYDFDIEPNAIISDKLRFDAIRNGASKALDSFIAQVASDGIEARNDN